MQAIDIRIKANRIEEILASLDNIKRAEAPPFLYGRIKTRLTVHEPHFSERWSRLISRPAITITLLLLIVLMDGIVVQSALREPSDTPQSTNPEFFASDNFEGAMIYGSPVNEYDLFY